MGRWSQGISRASPQLPFTALQKAQGAVPGEAFATAADHLWIRWWAFSYFLSDGKMWCCAMTAMTFKNKKRWNPYRCLKPSTVCWQVRPPFWLFMYLRNFIVIVPIRILAPEPSAACGSDALSMLHLCTKINLRIRATNTCKCNDVQGSYAMDTKLWILSVLTNVAPVAPTHRGTKGLYWRPPDQGESFDVPLLHTTRVPATHRPGGE